MISVMIYAAKVAKSENVGSSAGKNNVLIKGITNNINTKSYPSSDHPSHEPKTMDFCCLVSDVNIISKK